MNSRSLMHKRVRRRQAQSVVRHLAARLGSLVGRRRAVPAIPLAPFDDL